MESRAVYNFILTVLLRTGEISVYHVHGGRERRRRGSRGGLWVRKRILRRISKFKIQLAHMSLCSSAVAAPAA